MLGFVELTLSKFDFDATLRELSLTTLPTAAPDVVRPLSALHRVVIRNDVALCIMLLQNGADVHRLDSRGKSVVDLAVEIGDTTLLKSMLETWDGCQCDKLPRSNGVVHGGRDRE